MNSFRVYNIYPRYFRVTGSGDVRPFEPEVCYASSPTYVLCVMCLLNMILLRVEMMFVKLLVLYFIYIHFHRYHHSCNSI